MDQFEYLKKAQTFKDHYGAMQRLNEERYPDFANQSIGGTKLTGIEQTYGLKENPPQQKRKETDELPVHLLSILLALFLVFAAELQAQVCETTQKYPCADMCNVGACYGMGYPLVFQRLNPIPDSDPGMISICQLTDYLNCGGQDAPCGAYSLSVTYRDCNAFDVRVSMSTCCMKDNMWWSKAGKGSCGEPELEPDLEMETAEAA